VQVAPSPLPDRTHTSKPRYAPEQGARRADPDELWNIRRREREGDVMQQVRAQSHKPVFVILELSVTARTEAPSCKPPDIRTSMSLHGANVFEPHSRP
jgi:hypothetical protein